MTLHEWNSREYHRLSDPQHAWGRVVLARLSLTGDETVIDAGCGSGRLTAELLERLPRGRVIAVDRSENMIAAAREHLAPRFGDRVSFVCADLANLPLPAAVADAVFSTATFHWIPDHEGLFRTLARVLRPGGRLIAQCGGAGNIARMHRRALDLMGIPAFAPYFTSWIDPWNFADPQTTVARLATAGFTDADASLESAPTSFTEAATFRAFLESIILRAHLQRIPEPAHRDRFIDALVEQCATDTPPYTLDYVRLNLTARATVRP
jgi:trans-aconitate methyltransferase